MHSFVLESKTINVLSKLEYLEPYLESNIISKFQYKAYYIN